ncbi:MAG: DUF3990 domain-containing protein [Clostridia bacterium]|nr:DUF3990 domain-containing protein [Clostridia bacterium]
MIVYHGSHLIVDKPDIVHSRDNLDFGKGFYVTDLKEQAEAWTERFSKNNKQPILNVYDLDIEAVTNDFKVKKFDEHNEEWLDYIISCRRGVSVADYDVIIGGIANDRVYDTIELYFDNLIDKTEAIKRLKYYKPNNQICIANQAVIDKHLTFIKSEVVHFDS